MTDGRITFSGSPWPGGHRLEKLVLTVQGGADGGVRLHLHAESEPYAAEGPGINPVAGTEAPAWEQPGVWVQHESAIISSTHWGNAGIPLRLAADQLDEARLAGEYAADPAKKVSLDRPAEELAFGCHVLGQNLCGDHQVVLKRVEPNVFDLRWTGRVAATFVGEEDFSGDHRFEVTASGVRLS